MSPYYDDDGTEINLISSVNHHYASSAKTMRILIRKFCVRLQEWINRIMKILSVMTLKRFNTITFAIKD